MGAELWLNEKKVVILKLINHIRISYYNIIIMKLLKTTILTVIMAVAAQFSAMAELPSAKLTTLDGKTVDAATLSNDGKPFVISFWATWCKPCLRELKAISEYYADWQDETGMKLIAVSIDEAQNVTKVKPTADAEGWEYEVLIDTNGEFKRAMGVQLIPHLLIVDGEGNVVETRQGYTDGSEQHIIEKIRSLSED